MDRLRMRSLDKHTGAGTGVCDSRRVVKRFDSRPATGQFAADRGRQHVTSRHGRRRYHRP